MHLSREIEIAAPPGVVWDITVDVTRWPEWTPTVKSIEWVEGDSIAEGNRARIVQPGIPPAVWRVTTVQPGRRFSWRTRNMGATYVGTHTVEPSATGTKAGLALDVSGIGGVLMWPVLSLALRRVLRQEASGLKALAEERAGSASTRGD